MLRHRKNLRRSTIIVVFGVVMTAIFFYIIFKSPDDLYVEPLNIGSEIIQFIHTDENSGEDIIIKSDKEIYEGYDVSDVYFTLANTSKQSQKIAILSYFPKEYGDLNYVDVWQASPTDNKPAWYRLPITRGDVRTNMTKLAKAWERKKPVPEEYEVMAGTQFEIPAGHTAYFRTEITYPPGEKGEFWFEAFGDDGGYGLLDPTFVSGGNKLGTSASSDTTPGWYSTGGTWDYRRKITIDETKVSGTSNLSNFPTLISLTYSDLKHTSFSGKVASSSAGVTGGGGDFVFTSSDGTTKLDHEIEKYASSSGELWAWVEVPTLSVSQDTSIYVYYGGPSSGATNQNPTGVWDANYVGVWHMKEDPAVAGTNGVRDSTSNGNHGTDAGSMNAADQVTGRIGGGLDFDGTDDRIENSLTSNVTPLTISAWIKADTGGEGNAGRIVAKANQFLFSLDFDAAGPVDKEFGLYRYFSGTDGFWSAPTNTISLGQWEHVVVTYASEATTEDAVLYNNGVSVAPTEEFTPTLTADTNTNAWIFGSGDTSGSNAFDGIIDEIRISNTDRSADWIKTEYNNQFRPSTYYSVSGLQSRTSSTTKIASTTTSTDTTPGWYAASGNTWGFRKKITIDYKKVSGTSNLSNFPVLVYRTDADFKHTSFSGNVASSSAGVTGGGGDFVFTSSDGTTKLDHEIEKYASSSGELWAWVEVPTLSVSQDTSIYVYYGGPSSGATNQNPTGTFDTANNWQGVWHMSDLLDSTSGGRTLTNSSATINAGSRIGGGGDVEKGTTDSAFYTSSIPTTAVNNITMSAWAKPETTNLNAGIIVNGDEPTDGYGLDHGCGVTDSVYRWVDSGSGCNSTTISITGVGSWDYVVAVRDAGTWRFYKNGVVSGATVSFTPGTPTGKFTIGGVICNSDGLPCFEYDGMIDEARISDAVRSADWIKTEYNNQFRPSTFAGFGGEQSR